MAKAAKTKTVKIPEAKSDTFSPEQEIEIAQKISDTIDKQIVDEIISQAEENNKEKVLEVYNKIIEDFSILLEKKNTIQEQPSEVQDEVKKEEDIKDIQEFLVNVKGEENAEALKEATKIEEGLGNKGLSEETKKELKELSAMAIKWRDYIKYIGFTPESFLLKYPTNKFKVFVEEIIEFNKNSNETNI